MNVVWNMRVTTQASKYSKLSNGKLDCSNTGKATGSSSSSSFQGMGEVGGDNRLRGWQNSSRIIRVSRASGGKDRHSKVWTAKGPRDRRVRLSVNTAIQFYDLQDRLGVDQPSKAVEWLIKAASDAISELPCLNSSFPETPSQQMSDDKTLAANGIANDNDNDNDEQGFDSSAELDIVQTQTNISKSSACSSTSETSKGEIRVKARERAAKDKEREVNNNHHHHQQQQQSSSSFTQLLTSGIGNINTLGLIQLGNQGMHHQQQQQQHIMSLAGGDENNNSHELQHFPFISDHHLIVPSLGAGGSGGTDHYNLNFSISPSSSLASFNNNRGTLQSNSLLPHFQRFPSSHQLDGSTLPFFLGSAVENQHHQQQNHHPNAGQFPSGLQLCYGDNGGGLSDHKGKRKN